MKLGHILILFTLFLSCSLLTENDKEKDSPSFMKDTCPVWSPITNKIAYFHGGKITTPGVYLIDPDGSNNHLLFSSVVVDNIIWGNSENEFIFDAYNQIWWYNYETDSSFQITNTPGGNFFPSLSPNGKEILYSKSLSIDNYKLGIRKISIDGSGDSFIVGGLKPCYTPDGNGFVYCGDDGTDELEIFKYSFIDSSSKKLTNMKWNCSHPKISPNGDLIVFLHQANYLDYFDIYIMDSDGSKLRLLTRKGYYPSFSPDSKWVVYTNTDSRDGRIWKISVKGGEKIAITPPAPDSYFDEHDNSHK